MLQAGWKETHLQFATQLKNLVAHGVTEIGPALKNAFDMLNMNRNQSGIDTYGQVLVILIAEKLFCQLSHSKNFSFDDLLIKKIRLFLCEKKKN